VRRQQDLPATSSHSFRFNSIHQRHPRPFVSVPGTERSDGYGGVFMKLSRLLPGEGEPERASLYSTTMSIAILSAVFLTGLLGGVHCAGMCGGIVAALSGHGAAQRLPLHLAYSTGRVTSYAVAGALAGAAGGLGLLLDGVLPVQLALYVLANLMLIGLGLYLAGVSSVATWMERAGMTLWRRIQPLTGRLLPADTLPRALTLGLLWGWLPCGLVYAVLATALLTGDPLNGAAVMAAFGLGTVPNLLLAGLAMRRLKTAAQARPVRLAAGGLVLGFGVYGLANAASLSEHVRAGLICFG